MTKIIGETVRGIETFAAQFRRNPFDWLYESDLQASLSEILRRQFRSCPAKLRGGFYEAPKYGRSTKVSLSPVKTEYPGGTRFDIAIIDTRKPKLFEEGERSDPFWNQPVRIALELKYCWIGYNPLGYIAKVRKDLAKISKYRKAEKLTDCVGFALVFFQDAKAEIQGEFARQFANVCSKSSGPTECWAITPNDTLRVRNR